MATPNGFRNRVRHTQRGEGVTAAVDSRPTRDLESQTNYLKRQMESSLLGQAVGRDEVPMGSEVFLGAAIYYDTTAETHLLALAGVEADSTSGTVVPAPTAFCVGICVSKTGQTGRVISVGWVDISAWAEAMGVDEPGLYYLSSRDPGELTLQRPAVGIPVLHYIGGGRALVYPQIRNLGEEHVHYSFKLEPDAAGDKMLVGSTWSIGNADSSRRGWLPAGHEVFNGAAPEGAKFGYNLAAHEGVRQVWPPVPADAVEMIWDTGENRAGTNNTEFIVGSEDALVRMDSNGIWWMTDCDPDVPWYNLDSSSSSGSSSSSSSSSGDSCPARSQGPVLRLSFARISYPTARGVVTSLTPKTGSGLTVTDADGNEAATGDLEIGFEGEFLLDTEDPDVNGAVVLKQIDGTNFKQGYVTEGLYPVDDSVELTASKTKELDLGAVLGTKTVYMGVVGVRARVQPDERLLDVGLTYLAGAQTDVYQSIPFLNLPASRTGEMTMLVKVPLDNLPDDPVVLLRSSFFVSSAGTVPEVTGLYRVVPAGTDEAQALPTSDEDLETGVGGQDLSAYEYVAAESGEVAVTAGDQVVIKLRRDGRNDGFSGLVGLLDLAVVLRSASEE